MQSTNQIAATAQQFGQEDDITVLTLAFSRVDHGHESISASGFEAMPAPL
ncbi:MAG TPA: hypothetical protein VK716_15985 [Terracidiphilus sp.]|nr:hypothetical protein [Terracidiphilus sp.]